MRVICRGFLISQLLLLCGCKPNFKKDLLELNKIDSSITITDWVLHNKEVYSGFAEYTLLRTNQDTNYYLHFARPDQINTVDTLTYKRVYLQIEFYDSIYFNEIVISSKDTLYHLQYPKEGVDFENPHFRRDTINLKFKLGEEYYYDYNLIKPSKERKVRLKNMKRDTIPYDEKPLVWED